MERQFNEKKVFPIWTQQKINSNMWSAPGVRALGWHKC